MALAGLKGPPRLEKYQMETGKLHHWKRLCQACDTRASPGRPSLVKALIADGDTLMRTLTTHAVRARGHEIVEATDGQQARHIFDAEHPPLVIIDWNMPSMTGVDVTRHIRASEWSRETFVVMLTARDAGEDLLAALDAGVDDYVTKPVMLSHLRARIAIAERRVEQNAARWRAEAELAESRWLAGVGELAIALQHEINNPLASLISHASLLSASETLVPDDASTVQILLTEARRIANVVKRLTSTRTARSVQYAGGMRMVDLEET
jgi:DNA-binding response OmpR family regulator